MSKMRLKRGWDRTAFVAGLAVGNYVGTNRPIYHEYYINWIHLWHFIPWSSVPTTHVNQ